MRFILEPKIWTKSSAFQININYGWLMSENDDEKTVHARVWHSFGFWHERISKYIRVKKITRTNIRIYSYDTNEYPNVFVWNCLRRTNIRIYSYQNFDTNEYPNKYLYWKLYEYWNIFEYSLSSYTLTHSRTNIRIYSFKQI